MVNTRGRIFAPIRRLAVFGLAFVVLISSIGTQPSATTLAQGVPIEAPSAPVTEQPTPPSVDQPRAEAQDNAPAGVDPALNAQQPETPQTNDGEQAQTDTVPQVDTTATELAEQNNAKPYAAVVVKAAKVKEGKSLRASLVIEHIDVTDDLTVVAILPPGLDYEEKSSKLAAYDPAQRTLTWTKFRKNAERKRGSVKVDDFRLLATRDGAAVSFAIQTTLTGSGIGAPAEKTTEVVAPAIRQSGLIAKDRGGRFQVSDRIELEIPEGALTQDQDLVVGDTSREKLSANKAWLLEFGPDQTFQKPLRLKIKLAGQLDPIEYQKGYRLVLNYVKPVEETRTYVDANGQQQSVTVESVEFEQVPSTFDAATQEFVAEISHFSQYQLSLNLPKAPQPWQFPTRGGSVANFRGSATYAHPVSVPAMVDGLQPDLTLNYSSAAADSFANGRAPGLGLTLGMGWEMSVPRISRAMKREWGRNGWGNTPANTATCTWGGPDSCFPLLQTKWANDFTLELNGQSHNLVPNFDPNAQTGGEYRTEQYTPLRILRCNTRYTCGTEAIPGANAATEYWVVQTPNGVKWVFGVDANSTNAVPQKDRYDEGPSFMSGPGADGIGAYDPAKAFAQARAMYAGEVAGQVTRAWFLRRAYALNRDSISAGRWSVEWTYTDQGYQGGADEIKRCVNPGYNPPNPCQLAIDQILRPVSIVYGPSIRVNGTAATRRYKVDFAYSWGTRLSSLTTSIVAAANTATVIAWLKRTAVNVNAASYGDLMSDIKDYSYNNGAWVQFPAVTTFNYTDLSLNTNTRTLLAKITNGYGGEWYYAYTGATAWDAHVVNKQTILSGAGWTGITEYAYANPCIGNSGTNSPQGKCVNPAHVHWTQWSNKLVGFDDVTVKTMDPASPTTVLAQTRYRYFANAVDDFKKLGRPHEIKTSGKDSDGVFRVLRSSKIGYDVRTGPIAGTYMALTTVQKDYPEGDFTLDVSNFAICNNTVACVLTEHDYNTHGHPTFKKEHGLVGRTGDERTTWMSYQNNGAVWLVGTVSRINVYSGIQATDPDSGAALLARTKLYYDTYATSWPTTPTKGQIWRIEREPFQAGRSVVSVQANYDTVGNITTLKDGNGNDSYAEYDLDGWVVLALRSPLMASGQLTTKYIYYCINESSGCTTSQPYGALKAIRDPNTDFTNCEASNTGCVQTLYSYDAHGRLRKVAKPGDSLTHPTEEHFYFDVVNPYVVRYARKTAGVGVAAGPWDSGWWTAGGAIDLNALATWSRIYHDGLGRVIQSQTPFGTWTGSGTPVVLTDQVYDAFGRVWKQSVPYSKNDTGARQAADTAQPQSVTEYDGLNRPIKGTAPDATVSQTRYGFIPSAIRVRSVDALGRSKVHASDGLGRMVNVEEYTGVCTTPTTCAANWVGYASTTYAYSGLDNLTGVTDQAGNQTSIAYNGLGEKISMTDPDMGSWVYGYDANGNLTSQRDARNQWIYMSYDAINRLDTKRLNSTTGTIIEQRCYEGACGNTDPQFKINARGRLVHVQRFSDAGAWSNSQVYFYDPRGRVNKQRNQVNTPEIGGSVSPETSWTYDQSDRVASMTYPNGEVMNSTYNAAGQQVTLQSATWGTTPPNSFAIVSGADYNALGQAIRTKFGNGLTSAQYFFGGNLNAPITNGGNVNYRYGRLRQTCVLPTASGLAGECQDSGVAARAGAGVGSAQFNMYYDYDAVGNISATYDQYGPTGINYAYDALDRLTGVSGGITQNYTYNEIGNMTSKTGIGTMSYNDPAHKHAVTHIGAGQIATYDANGNMLTRWNSNTWYNHQWNAENRLTRVTEANSLTPDIRFEYEGAGARAKKVDVATAGYDALTVYVGSHYEASNDQVWVDDRLPRGAVPAVNDDAWTWVSASPAPRTGNTGHQSSLFAGMHQHYFTAAEEKLSVAAGDKLYAWIYVDPANPPSEVMLQWYADDATGWEHRAYWGANNINFGTNGTASRFRACACLPAAGRWQLIGVPASSVGLEGKTVSGMAFTLFGGRATWDKAGKLSQSLNVQTSHYKFNGKNVAVRNLIGQASNINVTWLHGDHLGSASMASNGNGVKIGELRYMPFGEPRLPSGGIGNDKRFTGQRAHAELGGLMDYNARFYDPTLGRFISADTIVPRTWDPQGLNRYSYVLNMPTIHTDSTGHLLDEEIEQYTGMRIDQFNTEVLNTLRALKIGDQVLLHNGNSYRSFGIATLDKHQHLSFQGGSSRAGGFNTVDLINSKHTGISLSRSIAGGYYSVFQTGAGSQLSPDPVSPWVEVSTRKNVTLLNRRTAARNGAAEGLLPSRLSFLGVAGFETDVVDFALGGPAPGDRRGDIAATTLYRNTAQPNLIAVSQTIVRDGLVIDQQSQAFNLNSPSFADDLFEQYPGTDFPAVYDLMNP
jgi:RHS repeat-associated protein